LACPIQRGRRILKNIANTVVVLDFETTGLSPNYGDRPIEIGAVLLKNGEIIDRFQKLMNPGVLINSFIENYTGITNKMLADQPSCENVMTEFSEFIGDYNLVAHNASFDKRFLDYAMSTKFGCDLYKSTT
jgi:DNA polymerase III subunit epsilon